MNILVTGATGQLGNEIKTITENKKDENRYFYTNENQVDITKKEEIAGFT